MIRTIHITAIHNRTRPSGEVPVPNMDGSALMIPADETVEGSWFIRSDTRAHPELHDIASENQMWFTDSPNQSHFGSVTLSVGMQPLRLDSENWIRLYDGD